MGVADPDRVVFRFGTFELDPRSEELRKAGTPVKLQPQPLRVLLLLARRQGELVTREEIKQKLWGDETFGDFERGINFSINQIRAALGDDVQTPRYVETLPRRGYRFIAPVESLETPAVAADLGGRKTRLAVLPFANFSGDPSQEYLSDGITEEITTHWPAYDRTSWQ